MPTPILLTMAVLAIVLGALVVVKAFRSSTELGLAVVGFLLAVGGFIMTCIAANG